jgi:hypothetical protein
MCAAAGKIAARQNKFSHGTPIHRFAQQKLIPRSAGNASNASDTKYGGQAINKRKI